MHCGVMNARAQMMGPSLSFVMSLDGCMEQYFASTETNN
jgi:hypothetical protein